MAKSSYYLMLGISSYQPLKIAIFNESITSIGARCSCSTSWTWCAPSAWAWVECDVGHRWHFADHYCPPSAGTNDVDTWSSWRHSTSLHRQLKIPIFSQKFYKNFENTRKPEQVGCGFEQIDGRLVGLDGRLEQTRQEGIVTHFLSQSPNAFFPTRISCHNLVDQQRFSCCFFEKSQSIFGKPHISM